MRVNRHKRQIVLFLAAILAPEAVLIGLAARIFHQDRELAAKRALDQRHAAVDQVRRELAASLEAVKLQEINRLMRSPDPDHAPPGNPAVLFTAKVENHQLVFPWDPASQAAVPVSMEFAESRQRGEAFEFINKNYPAAAAAYRQALAVARRPAESAEAELLLARALAKAGHTGESSGIYQALLRDSSARDDQGVAYRFYAAERLLAVRQQLEPVFNVLKMGIDGDGHRTPPELYLIRSLLDSFPPSQTGQLRRQVGVRIAQMEQALALGRDFPRVRAQVESDSGPVWVPYGEEPWLVTMAPAAPPLSELVIAVSSARVAPPGVKLLGRSAEGEALGDSFPGLHVQWTDNRALEATRQGLPAGLWVAALALVLGIPLFGGYLLLRDVNRDVRLTEMRSQFVASVSHELKTPLTAIRMFAETLALGRGRDERTKSEYLETIVNESERLARLVDNVLDFSKIEQGKKIYRLRPTRLQEIAESAVRAMQFPLAQQGFQLHVSVQKDLPELQADADAIQQAILNLLTNAMKYSGDGREIDLRLNARNGDAVIEVSDRGLGLAPDEQKHVFDKFYRAPSHESHLIAGTGLGLTLVAHIAKAHGGRIKVESSPGGGSTFSILLPIGEHA